jgi:hypothetical protein
MDAPVGPLLRSLAKRILANLDLVDQHAPRPGDIDQNRVPYPDTQLLISLLGVLVFPHERTPGALGRLLKNYGALSNVVTIEYPKLNQSDIELVEASGERHRIELVEGLPLPDTLPPIEIGGFRRLDAVAEIRDLAKNWQNCLADCLFNVNEGTSAIYLSDHLQAVCFLCRHGRMGWFLVQTKGPKNAAIEPDQLAQIHAAFADAGIPQSSMIEAIKSTIKTDEWPRYYPELDADENFDDMMLD